MDKNTDTKRIQNLYNRAIDRGMRDVLILDPEYVYEMEPNLNVKINIQTARIYI